jgi:uncharacterized protein YbaA (DUF1428 family)
MAKYVDGFSLGVPKDKNEQYKKMVEEGIDMQMPFDMKRMTYGGFQVEVDGNLRST